MAQGIVDRDLLTLAEAAKRIPGRPHTTTIWRWCRRGHRGITLPYRRLGRRILIDPYDVDRFAQRLAELDQREPAQSSPRQTSRSRRASRAERAEREADREGI